MRHSIIGERDGIDKERAEIGMKSLWSGLPCPENYARARPPATSERRGRGSTLFRKRVLPDCAE